MRLYPNQLQQHLARGLAPIYVVAGEEPLLIEEALDAIRAAARKQGYSEREVLDVDQSFDWQRLIDSYASLSLFASKRIVELRMPRGITGGSRKKAAADDDADGESSEKSGGGSGAKILPELAKHPAPDTLLIVVCGKLEYRTRSGGWYLALENAGASVYCEPIKPDRLPAWLQARMKQAGLTADAEAVALLAERTEGHLLAAAQDIEKLKLLFQNGRIGAEQIAQAVADSARFEAFDLSDKILSGDAGGAIRALERLRDEGDEIPKILGALAYDLRTWAAAALIHEKNGNAAMAVDQVRVWKSRQASFIKGLERARAPQILGWLARLADVEARFKSAVSEQSWEELLTCIAEASGAQKAALRPAA
ncbi:MAG TPA: DNA polymerase III subunit delta [Nevskiaceae bacterium]|nr:DNA polymerase III subunit delta [Nevskiaceae bacterium]